MSCSRRVWRVCSIRRSIICILARRRGRVFMVKRLSTIMVITAIYIHCSSSSLCINISIISNNYNNFLRRRLSRILSRCSLILMAIYIINTIIINISSLKQILSMETPISTTNNNHNISPLIYKITIIIMPWIMNHLNTIKHKMVCSLPNILNCTT